ncbi:MAG: hypothetical protein P0Y59_04650 [Candidatus Sphingomonas phytovorans]|nr:hypothetical protein [Sphingomonas sp.]WEK00991.1 MAG: hypothetical protein P0Y59_04650 [Sphingomonas sp.]
MTFIADNAALRTYDPDRGIELHLIGGGSSGISYFKLIQHNVEIQFSAHMEAQANGAFVHDKEEIPNIIVWVVHKNRGILESGVTETDAIIREAMKAYKGSHGIPARQLVEVVFQ